MMLLRTARHLDGVSALLGRWNALHGVRSLLSLTALVIFLIARS